MNFVNDAHREHYERVKRFLPNIVGNDSLVMHPDKPVFTIMHGSAIISVSVHGVGDYSLVEISSYTVKHIEPSFELFDFLLRTNENLLFGAFSIDRDNDVHLRQLLPGDTLDFEELQLGVISIAEASDKYDNEIVRRFGGVTGRDSSESILAEQGIRWPR